MATMTKSLNLRVDADLKAQAERIFSELGLPTSTAITMFLKSVVRYNGIPLELRLDEIHNDETIKAIQEVEEGVDIIGPFHSVDEVMEELNA